jgi:hypothetical protein
MVREFPRSLLTSKLLKKSRKSFLNIEGEKQVKSTKEQMAKVTEDGVEFKSFIDGSKHFFSPETIYADTAQARRRYIFLPLTNVPHHLLHADIRSQLWSVPIDGHNVVWKNTRD